MDVEQVLSYPTELNVDVFSISYPYFLLFCLRICHIRIMGCTGSGTLSFIAAFRTLQIHGSPATARTNGQPYTAIVRTILWTSLIVPSAIGQDPCVGADRGHLPDPSP
jgi:hypothetical protein